MNQELEPNVALTGDEARILMASLRTTSIGAPIGVTVNLYLKLAAIAQVQPPV